MKKVLGFALASLMVIGGMANSSTLAKSRHSHSHTYKVRSHIRRLSPYRTTRVRAHRRHYR